MYKQLLLGALVAMTSPQDSLEAQEIRGVDQEATNVAVQIPAVSVPEFDIYVPSFEFYVPTFDFSWDGYYLEDFEVDWSGYEVHVPEIEIEVPAFRYDWNDPSYDREHYPQTETDTTFDVNPNALLSVRNHAGEIIIRTWDRSQIRLEASHSSEDRVKVLQSESAVRIKSETRHGNPDVVDYELTVPRTMALDLWGFDADVSVDGARNGIQAETMSGDIEVRDAEGALSLRSVEGDIEVLRARGHLEINGVEGDISILDYQGELYAESIDGDIVLEGISSDHVEAKTVDGDVSYDGTVNDSGRYRLTTHDGDVIVAIPQNANATVSVATFDGEFMAEFPIQLQGAEASRKFNFVLGNGGARVELQSFDGDIRLTRR
jgi:DUF4097 and DUF4098 domain-containing protein YvlB